jgi:hypothetical protein
MIRLPGFETDLVAEAFDAAGRDLVKQGVGIGVNGRQIQTSTEFRAGKQWEEF